MMTRAEAIAQVSLFVAAQSYPQMSTTDIGSILDSFSRFTTWTAATTYAVGDRVVPTTPNGRVYECRVAGTSGASEPEFPAYPPYQYKGWEIDDGSSDPTLTWVDQGDVLPDPDGPTTTPIFQAESSVGISASRLKLAPDSQLNRLLTLAAL